MSNRIYVGNLSFHTAEPAVRAAFEPFGAIDRIDIPMDRETGRPRGFAFVTMAEAASARKAIDALNGSSLDGRSLRVDLAQERRPRGGDRW